MYKDVSQLSIFVFYHISLNHFGSSVAFVRFGIQGFCNIVLWLLVMYEDIIWNETDFNVDACVCMLVYVMFLCVCASVGDNNCR